MGQSGHWTRSLSPVAIFMGTCLSIADGLGGCALPLHRRSKSGFFVNNILDGPLADLDEPRADDAFGNDHIRGRPRFLVKRGARLQDGRATIFDVSEGTALDPLQDRNWDLNSSKIVPGVQNEPGDNHGNPPVASAAPTKAPKLKKVRAPSE